MSNFRSRMGDKGPSDSIYRAAQRFRDQAARGRWLHTSEPWDHPRWMDWHDAMHAWYGLPMGSWPAESRIEGDRLALFRALVRLGSLDAALGWIDAAGADQLPGYPYPGVDPLPFRPSRLRSFVLHHRRAIDSDLK